MVITVVFQLVTWFQTRSATEENLHHHLLCGSRGDSWWGLITLYNILMDHFVVRCNSFEALAKWNNLKQNQIYSTFRVWYEHLTYCISNDITYHLVISIEKLINDWIDSTIKLNNGKENTITLIHRQLFPMKDV